MEKLSAKGETCDISYIYKEKPSNANVSLESLDYAAPNLAQLTSFWTARVIVHKRQNSNNKFKQS